MASASLKAFGWNPKRDAGATMLAVRFVQVTAATPKTFIAEQAVGVLIQRQLGINEQRCCVRTIKVRAAVLRRYEEPKCRQVSHKCIAQVVIGGLVMNSLSLYQD
jgi:hypothetical protein